MGLMLFVFCQAAPGYSSPDVIMRPGAGL